MVLQTYEKLLQDELYGDFVPTFIFTNCELCKPVSSIQFYSNIRKILIKKNVVNNYHYGMAEPFMLNKMPCGI